MSQAHTGQWPLESLVAASSELTGETKPRPSSKPLKKPVEMTTLKSVMSLMNMGTGSYVPMFICKTLQMKVVLIAIIILVCQR